MKKITYVSFSATPSTNPSSLQIVKTCEALSKLGYDTELIIPNTGINNKIDFFYNIKNKFKIRKIKFVKSFPVGLSFYIYSLVSFLIILFKSNNVTITRSFFVSFLLSFFSQKNILELHHDISIEGRISKFLVKKTNFLNNSNLYKIVAISKSLKKLYSTKYKVSKNKIIILPSGSSILTKLNLNIKKNTKRFNIGYFGSISESKGIKTILKLSKIDQGNNYYIYGGDKKKIAKLRIQCKNKNIHLQHHLPYTDVVKKINIMDLLIIPYTNNVKSAGEVDNIVEYTSPLKLFDYLACGKIIISSDLRVLREVLSNKNCFFVKNYENIFNWKHVINKVKNLNEKQIIYKKINFNYSKKFNHIERVKKYI